MAFPPLRSPIDEQQSRCRLQSQCKKQKTPRRLKSKTKIRLNHLQDVPDEDGIGLRDTTLTSWMTPLRLPKSKRQPRLLRPRRLQLLKAKARERRERRMTTTTMRRTPTLRSQSLSGPIKARLRQSRPMAVSTTVLNAGSGTLLYVSSASSLFASSHVTPQTKYTIPAVPGPGYLCHPCAKSGNVDPFKKPAAPKRRKTATDRRTVTHFEERLFPSLASLCIEVETLTLLYSPLILTLPFPGCFASFERHRGLWRHRDFEHAGHLQSHFQESKLVRESSA